MSWDERRYDPLSLRAHSHVCSSGCSTDKGDSRDLMMILLQDLAVEVNGEQLRPRTHSNQMPTNVVMGANCDIWEGEAGHNRQSALCNEQLTHQVRTEHLLCISRCFWGYRPSCCASCPGSVDIGVLGKQAVTAHGKDWCSRASTRAWRWAKLAQKHKDWLLRNYAKEGTK